MVDVQPLAGAENNSAYRKCHVDPSDNFSLYLPKIVLNLNSLSFQLVLLLKFSF